MHAKGYDNALWCVLLITDVQCAVYVPMCLCIFIHMRVHIGRTRAD